jgi:hypothetical protein
MIIRQQNSKNKNIKRLKHNDLVNIILTNSGRTKNKKMTISCYYFSVKYVFVHISLSLYIVN